MSTTTLNTTTTQIAANGYLEEMTYIRDSKAKIIASWPGELNTYGDAFTARCWKLIDPQTVTSATNIIDMHDVDWNAVASNTDLSSSGKEKQLSSIANRAWGVLPACVRDFTALHAEHAKDVAAVRAAAVPAAEGPGDVMVDLALAAQVLANPRVPTMLELQSSERVKTALARVPLELSGITAETQSRLIGSLISPTEAARLARHEMALGRAHAAVQGAIARLSPADMKAIKKREHLGDMAGLFKV